jgi:hypothetical protein
MYFPYIRGRLYDLLALQMLVKNIKLNQNLIPIIEPVRLSSTFLNTLEIFIQKGHKLCIICNPEVGTFNKELESREDKNIENSNKFYHLLENPLLIKTCIIQENCKSDIIKYEQKLNIDRKYWYVICKNKNYYDIYLDLFEGNKPKITFVPDGSFFRRKINSNKVLLDDKFTKQKRNSDYLKSPDEFFSEDHIYYNKEGYIGFGDYSIIGSDYSDSEFAPYSVAIHITYFKSDRTLWVHHFVSNSNDDIQDPANKFYEANTKLIEWFKKDKLEKTIATKEFERIHNEGAYPGLGTVKKLSLMHHLEIMNKLINGLS